MNSFSLLIFKDLIFCFILGELWQYVCFEEKTFGSFKSKYVQVFMFLYPYAVCIV